ncbi:hypothetical protein CX649_07145 [Bacillaceae bacterium ZC4]|nr:hypothetical protein CX649_07145 [Bacillaceae bacterium ZC4]BBU38813.1 hypothetical protein APP_11050 [Aeribacillus pallidus]
MNNFERINFPFKNASDFPLKEQIEESLNKIEQNSPYKELATYSFNEILKFEQNKAKGDLFIKIHSPLPSGNIYLSALNTVSAGIQRVFTSVYNNFFGKGNSYGKIPKEIVESSELILKAATPGSFNLHITLKNNNPILASHDSDALKKFADLFEELDEQEDYTDIAEEYGIRTFNILKNWFQNLEKENIEFDYSNIKGKRTINLTKEKIQKTTQKLMYIKTKEKTEPLNIQGELVSASSANNSFAILADGKIIKGKTSSNIFDIGLTINETYIFNLTKKIIINTSNGERKESYFLNRVNKSN